VRVHRSRAVALAAVTSVEARSKGDSTLRLAGGAELACSRAYRAALLEALAAVPSGRA